MIQTPYSFMVQRPRRQTKISSVLPPITDGLTLFAPLTRDYGTVPVYSAAGSTGLSTEIVDDDATYIEAFSDLIVGASLNTARVGKYGLLSEVASTNLCLQSEDLATTWTDSGTPTYSANAGTAPDGNATADLIGDDDSGGLEAKIQGVTTTAAKHVFSVYAKAGTSTKIGLQLYGAGASPNVVGHFTLSGSGTATKHATATPDDVGIESVGGGWYRCWMAHTLEAEETSCRLYPAMFTTAGANDSTATGNAYFWGAQLEAQSAPTSYIPTTSAAVTRAEDNLEYPVSGNIAAAAGTVLFAFTPGQLTGTYIFDVRNHPNNAILVSISGGKFRLWIESGNVTQAELVSTNALVAGTTAVCGICWDTNDARLYHDGADEKSDTSVTVPAGMPTAMNIGAAYVGGYPCNGSLAYFLIYNDAKTAEEFAYLSDWIAERAAA